MDNQPLAFVYRCLVLKFFRCSAAGTLPGQAVMMRHGLSNSKCEWLGAAGVRLAGEYTGA